MKLLDKINIAGGKHNYDVIGYSKDCFWVIDGASAPIKSPLSYDLNQWLVEEFSSALKTSPNSTLKNKIKAAFTLFKKANQDKLQAVNQLKLNQQPSFALAVVGQTNNTIECGVIADCSIILQKHNGDIEIYTDNRVEKFSNLTKQAQTPELKHKQIIANRKFLNQPNGYWVGSCQPSWLNEVKTYQFPCNEINKILICSDGFTRAIDFNLFSWQQVLDQQFSFEHIGKQLRDFEQKNRSKDYKRHDDTSALLIDVES